MSMIVASATLVVVALVIHSLARNRVARGKLRFGLALGASALLLAAARLHPQVATGIPADLHLPELLLALGIITTAVAAILNPVLHDRTSARFPNIVQDAVIVVVFYVVATFAYRDSSLVTASAVSAIVVGFALQDTLGNAFAGLAIQIEKPFRVGHWIRIGDHQGKVQEVTWRATKLRTRGGTFVIVPNSIISKEAITNYSEPIVPVRLSVDIGATYLRTPALVKAALLEALQQTPHAILSPSPRVHLVDFGNSAIVYRLSFWIASYDDEETALDEARSAIFYSFARHQIEIPYPIQVEHSREEISTALSPDQVGAALDRVEIFSEMSVEERRALAAVVRERLFGAGEVVVRQDAAGASMFVVQSGEVRVTLDGEREVARIGPGGVLGEMSLLTGEPRTATVSAVGGDTVLLEIDAEAFRRVVLANPAVVEAISLIVVARRAGLDRVRAMAEEQRAALRVESQSLLARIRQFLRLPDLGAVGAPGFGTTSM
jgi:small-conductance mechanosensitive channel/CRP-like cAMP-binding protein